MGKFIVMLRAIGPVTHKVMSMAQWRAAAAADGFEEPLTYVATGNMVVSSALSAAEITRHMDAIVHRLGLSARNRAVVRSARQLQALAKADPFPEATQKRPGAVGVYFFAKARPDFGWVADYEGPERIAISGQHLVVDYDNHASNSRLPGIIEKKSGVVTARNWNTLRGLIALAASHGKSKD